jgi:hypothetical protein
MTTRVIQWATGAVGSAQLQQAIDVAVDHPCRDSWPAAGESVEPRQHRQLMLIVRGA